MRDNRFSSERALSGLKDFQRKTVDYVFDQLYGTGKTTRFLVADEVGLGKTLVARGVIAKAVEHLQDQVDRVDVIYICSNSVIASQNINRLNVSGANGFPIATRLTYLPKQVRSLRKNRVNFISLTPGTAFDHARSRGGHAEERAILYRILHDLPLGRKKRRKQLRAGLLNLLQATSFKGNWQKSIERMPRKELDLDLSVNFRKFVLADACLYQSLKDCCEHFSRYRTKIPPEDSEDRYSLIAKLRSALAEVCLSALEPDLVILDEFQRFKNLLEEEHDEASILANKLFNRPGVRVLLLSATPYKMYTLDQEADQDDHYPDFIKTLEFLYQDPARIGEVKNMLSNFRSTLCVCKPGAVQNNGSKVMLEKTLLDVMCRTERVAITRNHNSMLEEIEQEAPLKPDDLSHAGMVDRVSMCLKAGGTLEYWKSAPYLVNFLKNYELRKKLEEYLDCPPEQIREALSSGKRGLLQKENFESYSAVDPANPRMRVLLEDTIEKEMWKLLWMPPSMPYTKPSGVFENRGNLTKALVFSSWSAVPDAIASICSYEAERRMLSGKAGREIRQSELYDKIKPLLRFAVSSTNDNRQTGMPVIGWMLPSPTLATLVDPLNIALENGGAMPLVEMKEKAKAICRGLLGNLPCPGAGARADERWYWAAPILLDSGNGLLEWCRSETGWRSTAKENDDDPETRFRDHIDLLIKMGEGEKQLGPQPDDLVDVLADLALGGPGNCALRALLRLGEGIDPSDPTLLSSAARIASGFRSLFNTPETIAMLRDIQDDSYWRSTLQYGIDGNLQAMLDEYVHVLKELLGLKDHSPSEQAQGISECIQSVLSLRAAQIRIDEIKTAGEGLAVESFNTRCRFALRFGEIRDDRGQAVARADSVRDAFNSPFRPFILATTSIGQEGLDFHAWCHAVVHWNLPANPVDLEQREGRVHRYKGHAVRKNIAEKYGLKALCGIFKGGDPWEQLFDIASRGKPNGTCDLIPYWIFEEGSARVERRIPMLPYSKEIGKLKRLKKCLGLYRMAFGQPRQEDLLLNLSQKNHTNGFGKLEDWMISLEPPDSL